MTVTVVFGRTGDGYLSTLSPNYATTRAGTGATVNLSSAGYQGQNNNGGTYAAFQTAIGFQYAAPPGTEVIVSAAVRVSCASMLAPSVGRDLELWGVPWSTGNLEAADWVTPAEFTSGQRWGSYFGWNTATAGKYAYAGSNELRSILHTISAIDHVVVSSRQRAGTVPTSDEGSAIWLSAQSGTTLDPCMVFTTMKRTTLIGSLGGQARCSDGSTLYLVGSANPAPTLQVWHAKEDGSGAGVVATLPNHLSGNPNAFGDVLAFQTLALVVDAADNFYVIGIRQASTNNVQAYAFRRVGSNPLTAAGTWSLQGVYPVGLPAHDVATNQVAACVAGSGGTESVVVVAAHHAGAGSSDPARPDMAWAILSVPAMIAGNTGASIRATGNAIGSIFPSGSTGSDWNGFANEVGTGLDLVRDLDNPSWLYAMSFVRGQQPGANTQIPLARLILNATATGFTLPTRTASAAYALKDPNAKIRLVACGPGLVASVAADADAGFGLTATLWQHVGTTPASVALGQVVLGDESIPSMPDGPAVAAAPWWDAIYSAVDNALWIYYRDAADAKRLMRTSIPLDTMQASRVERLVEAYTGNISAVRCNRHAPAGPFTLVSVSWVNAGVETFDQVIDSFNVAPTAPTQVLRDGFDATVDADFTWVFNDPSPRDTQSAYQLHIRRTSDGVSMVDTGKVASVVSLYTLPGATLANAVAYQWRVQTWDAEDLVSPWSPWQDITTAAGGTVAITNPATDNPVDFVTDEVEVRWTPTGTVQTAFRVRLIRTDTETQVSDTGFIVSSNRSRLVTGMVTDVEHRLEVTVRNAANVVSNPGTRLITPSYSTPEMPTITVTPVAAGGYTLIQVNNPVPGGPEAGYPLWGFEDASTAGWTPTAATFTTTTAQAHTGTRAGMITVVGTVARADVRAASVPVVGNRRYTFQGFARRNNSSPCDFFLDWYNVSGVYISSDSIRQTLPAATWASVEVSANAPVLAAFCQYGPTIPNNPAAGAVMHVDDLILTEASDRPDVAVNQILRRRVGNTGAWTLLGTCPPNGSFRDYSAAGGVAYDYVARGLTV